MLFLDRIADELDLTNKMTNLVSMKVKVGQLKTHLSRYLKEIRETGEPIEVCVREDTVAYLTSSCMHASAAMPQPDPELARQLECDGLPVTHWGYKPAWLPVPGHCASPLKGENSVASIRAEKNW